MFAAATPSLAAALAPTTTLATGAPFALTSSVLPNHSPAKATELANIVAPATMAPIFFRFTFILSPQFFNRLCGAELKCLTAVFRNGILGFFPSQAPYQKERFLSAPLENNFSREI